MAVQSRIVLEPSAQGIVDATSTPPFLYELEPAQARKVLDDLQAAPIEKLPIEEEWITVPAAVGDVPVRIVKPAGSSAPLPVIVYMHGGGWILGNAGNARPPRPRARRRRTRGAAVRRVPKLARSALPGRDRTGLRHGPVGDPRRRGQRLGRQPHGRGRRIRRR